MELYTQSRVKLEWISGKSSHLQSWRHKFYSSSRSKVFKRTMVVAQLVERRGQLFESGHQQILLTVNCIEKTKFKKNEAGNDPFKKIKLPPP